MFSSADGSAPGGAAGAAFPSDKERNSFIVRPVGGSWVPSSVSIGHGASLLHDIEVIIRPTVGEAVAVWAPVQSMRERMARMVEVSSVTPATGKLVDEETGEYFVNEAATFEDLEALVARNDRNRGRCNARGARHLRRYMVHNKLCKMWVLTFAGDGYHGIEGRREAWRKVQAFIRRLRRALFRDRAFPYAFSPELHPDGHGWHVNLFLQDLFIDKHWMQRLWGNGNVWFTDFSKDRYVKYTGRRIPAVRAGSAVGGVARAAAKAAAYACKYAVKDWAVDEIGVGAHRYEIAEGFQPTEQRFRVRTFQEAWDLIKAHPAVGEVLDWLKLDCDLEGWDGPPMRLLRFANPVRPHVKRVNRAIEPRGLP